jgi:hypothetical protein
MIETKPEMSNVSLEITTDIILLDLVGYSLLNNEEQLRAVEVLHSDLTKEINFIAEIANLRNCELVLDLVPTGDGLYVLVNPQICGYGIPLAISIRNYLLWFASHQPDRLYHGVRVAVHMGKVLSFQGVNERRNYVGDGMNDCARLLSVADEAAVRFCGDTNYVIASEAACVWFHRLFADDKAKQFLATMKFKMSSQYQITDKHRKIHNVHLVDAFRLAFIPPPNFLRPRKRATTSNA